MYGTRFVNIFYNIITRCENKKTAFYNLYGGRGIKCLWKNSKHFIEDMHESYEAHVKKFGENDTTIERIDNNGHYSKENCRWATRAEQTRNTSRNKFFTLNGKSLPLREWAKIYKIHHPTLSNRIYCLKWQLEKALTIDPKLYHHKN